MEQPSMCGFSLTMRLVSSLCLHIGLSLSFHILIILKELGTFHKHRIVVLKRVF